MPASNTRKRKKNPGEKPKVSLHNRQARWKFSDTTLLRQSEQAWELISAKRPARTRIYREIEVVLVTPSVSRQWHRDHFADPTPTDVMTFPAPPLATLLVCPEVARKQCHFEQLPIHEEILTYIIHGFLHLAAWDDLTEAGYQAMRREQTRIRKVIL